MDQETQDNSGKMDAPIFATLVHSLTHSALAAMGLVPEMQDKKDRVLAEFNIDLLVLLKEKTKGNLTTEEKELMDNCIRDLQLTFAEQKEGV